MAQLTCGACGGQYDDGKQNGALYFHACPVGIDPAKARNENLASTNAATIKAAGLGTQPGKVVIAPSIDPAAPAPTKIPGFN